jgi:prepilin-type N-terminal cleavage/methylation domain-containing protein
MKTVFHKARQGGFTLLEFALVVVLSSVISAVVLNRFEFYREQAEMTAARQLVAALRTSLQVRSVQLASNGREQDLKQLAARNPIDLLAWKPANYLGEYYAPDPKQIGQPGWVFDPRDKSLVYLPKNTESFSFGTSRLLRFKVEFVRKNSNSLALNQVSG